MTYLLDTNACIQFLHAKDSSVARKMRAVPATSVVLRDIVKAELYFGVERSQRREKNLEALEAFFSAVRSDPFDGNAARHYGRIRAELAALGALIGPNDLLIAAVALAGGRTLITHNTGEFGRVKGLLLEDWQAEG